MLLELSLDKLLTTICPVPEVVHWNHWSRK